MYDEPFSILGISNSATVEELHAAFRKKAREHHPDLGGDRKKFQELSEAYHQILQQFESASPVQFEVQPQQTNADSANPFASPAGDTSRQTEKRSANSNAPFRRHEIKHLLTGKLPLQDQTTYFILVNALDIFLTYLILRNGGYEANPVAAWFINNWGIVGMITFKLSIVAAVCVISQIVALRSLKKAAMLLNLGTAIITCVVLYSIWLLAS